ncbi:MAG: recombination protein RecR [Ruminococcaceae bacterium]|nr:recombination protein RecR [Oscillospiraceae bacterium]
MTEYLAPLEKLIEQFRKLPGVGRKSAVRMAFSILDLSDEAAEGFTSAILDAKRQICNCEICHNLSVDSICPICADSTRNQSLICVVEDAKAIMAFEKVRGFRGVYHVLGGVISPINGVTPDKLAINDLVKRVEENNVEEVIIATNPTVEGETTATYISKLLKRSGTTVSRLAYGIPVGGDIEYADEVTLNRAIEGRRSFE